MKTKRLRIGLFLTVSTALLLLSGCTHSDAAAEAPPPATVVGDVDVSLFSVDHPEQFPLAAAVVYAAAPKLVVTGTVNPESVGAWTGRGPAGRFSPHAAG